MSLCLLLCHVALIYILIELCHHHVTMEKKHNNAFERLWHTRGVLCASFLDWWSGMLRILRYIWVIKLHRILHLLWLMFVHIVYDACVWQKKLYVWALLENANKPLHIVSFHSVRYWHYDINLGIWNLEKNNVCISRTLVWMEGAQIFFETWWYGQAITKQSV